MPSPLLSLSRLGVASCLALACAQPAEPQGAGLGHDAVMPAAHASSDAQAPQDAIATDSEDGAVERSSDARAKPQSAADAAAQAMDGGGVRPKDAGAQADARVDGGTVVPPPADGLECREATEPCTSELECCADATCGKTSLGQVCCGLTDAPCATDNGEDCCGSLLCLLGRCGKRLSSTCEAPCTPAPALTLERDRLAKIGGSFLGICGDANHTYGFHVAAAQLPSSDYSLAGEANKPICRYHAAAIDIGMDWPASRKWLRWLIAQVQSKKLTGIAEVIGSYDGKDVRYWSDSSGWSTDGKAYTGQGHDSWTHVSIHRSTALQDHHLLDGWSANGMR